jgi:hypothetical protein
MAFFCSRTEILGIKQPPVLISLNSKKKNLFPKSQKCTPKKDLNSYLNSSSAGSIMQLLRPAVFGLTTRL